MDYFETFIIVLVGICILLVFCLWIAWIIYEYIYYESKEFKELKASISQYISDCNALNQHIYTLKNTHIGLSGLDFGISTYKDNSIHNYKRPQLKNIKYEPYVYNCSRTVCDNARKQPFKYICKYFNIKANEENLSIWEKVLNNFEAAEQGKKLLINKKNEIMNGIKLKTPFLIRLLGKSKLERKLGFQKIDLKTIYFPKYIFNYISSGGYAATKCEIVLDINNLNKFVVYLSEMVKFRKSVAGQRALLTSTLRKKILARDNYTCKLCGNSQRNEPNLLLEIDHIVPLSKGGITSEKNLQVLCWRCNRSKGAKIQTPTPPKFSQYVNKNADTKTEAIQQFTNVIKVSADNKEKIVDVDLRKEVALTKPKCNYVGTNIELNEKSEIKFEESSEAKKKMYDVQNGIYPSGQYLVGEDIETGKYILTCREGCVGSVATYESYAKYKERCSLNCEVFKDDYFLALRENGLYIVVQNADIKKVL